MKRMTGIVLSLLIGLLFGCAETPIYDSRNEQEPIRIVGTVQTDEPTVPPKGSDALASPETVEIQTETDENTAPVTAAVEAPTVPPTAPPTETPAPTAEPTVEPTATPTPTPDLEGVDRFLEVAQSLLDKPYVRGGTTEEGFDPGGFVYYCLNQAGVTVSHKASRGYAEMDRWPMVESIDDVKKGDLLFFMTGSNESINCVCIYLGDGKMIYPSSSKGVVITTNLRSDYWQSAFMFARRVF